MKIYLILFAVITLGINDIAVINTLKEEAQEAYDKGEYEVALEKYHLLTDSMEISDEAITMNMANAYFHMKDTAQARSYYQELTDSENKTIKSTALNQIGVLSVDPENPDAALNYFKESLKNNPANENARYNYETIKKLIEEKKKEQNQDQDQQNQDQQKKNQEKEQDQKEQNSKDKNEQGDNQEQKEDGEKGENEEQQDQQNKDQQGENQQGDDQKEGEDQQQKEQQENEKEEGEEENKEEKEGEGKENKEEKESQANSAARKLEEMNISPQQAKMILDAMKSQEIQHLQQLRRRPTKRSDPGKPDW